MPSLLPADCLRKKVCFTAGYNHVALPVGGILSPYLPVTPPRATADCPPIPAMVSVEKMPRRLCYGAASVQTQSASSGTENEKRIH
jgi:hypothetical protein